MLISLTAKAEEPDSLHFRPTLSLGYDLSGLARNLLEPDVFMHGFSAAYEWQPNWFAALEAGTMRADIERETHNYDASGVFFRAGINYNLFQNKAGMEGEEIFLSVRYGYGTLSHEAPRIVINNPYWGPSSFTMERENYSAHWGEIGGGLKARLFWNIYLGWDVRIRFILAQTKDAAMSPYYISGYGRGKNNSAVMLHYSVYYKFPLGK